MTSAGDIALLSVTQTDGYFNSAAPHRCGVPLRVLEGPVEPELLGAIGTPEVLVAVLRARATTDGRRPVASSCGQIRALSCGRTRRLLGRQSCDRPDQLGCSSTNGNSSLLFRGRKGRPASPQGRRPKRRDHRDRVPTRPRPHRRRSVDSAGDGISTAEFHGRISPRWVSCDSDLRR
jgi:hypothetical protein